MAKTKTTKTKTIKTGKSIIDLTGGYSAFNKLKNTKLTLKTKNK